MQVEIYADMVFLINFVMDYFILWTVSKLMKKNITYKRLGLGAFSAAILFCLIIFIPSLQKVYNYFGALAILMIAIMITFSPKGIKEFIKLIVLFHITAFAVGGAGIALFYFTNISQVIGNMVAYEIHDFPLKLLLASTAASYVVIKLCWYWIKNKIQKNQTFYPIKIHFNNEDIDMNALVDTGNSLQDPITHDPVIIVEFSMLKAFLPDAVKLIFYEHKENDLHTIMQSMTDSTLACRIRMIPFSSLGTPNGMLIGFKPDSVEILNDEVGSYVLKNVIIGIYNHKLSRDNTYQALLNPEIFQKTI